MAYIGDSQGAAEIDPNAFIKLLGPLRLGTAFTACSALIS